MKQIYTTTLRLNLEKAEDRQAFEYLRRLDRRKYRSYSEAIVAAVDAYFGRQEALAADPYLETREKEDAFLRKVLETIRAGAFCAPLSAQAMAGQPKPNEDASGEEDMAAALDFADSF